MTPNPYTEDHLVEQPALELLAELGWAGLGWQIACGLEETFSPEGGSLGRRDRREVVVLRPGFEPHWRTSIPASRRKRSAPPSRSSAAIARPWAWWPCSRTLKRPTPSATAASTRLLA
jgi:hypothetical protein